VHEQHVVAVYLGKSPSGFRCSYKK